VVLLISPPSQPPSPPPSPHPPILALDAVVLVCGRGIERRRYEPCPICRPAYTTSAHRSGASDSVAVAIRRHSPLCGEWHRVKAIVLDGGEDGNAGRGHRCKSTEPSQATEPGLGADARPRAGLRRFHLVVEFLRHAPRLEPRRRRCCSA